jgi:peptide-methionine (S)-S-oxide reductase
MKGIIRTRVGYAGGTTKSPTYHNIGDHAEAIELDFDPTQISYKDLLDVFFSTHNACAKSYSRQYMSAIFYHGDEQKKLAQEAKEAAEKKRGKFIVTEISAAREFTVAEDYHQKYVLRSNRELLAEFEAIYPKAADLMNSTAAARVNAWLSGHPGKHAKDEIEKLGLSDGAKKLLARYVK